MSITIYPSQFNMREDGSYVQLPAIKGEEGAQGPPGIGSITGGTKGQVPVKQSSDDYDVAWEDIGWTLVWENASPNSAFDSQTVAVDLSPYTWAKIEFLRDKGTAPDLPLIFCIMEVEIDPEETTMRHVASGQANTNANDTFGRRIFTVRPTGVFFDTATWYNTYNSGGASNTNIVIPYRIYAR